MQAKLDSIYYVNEKDKENKKWHEAVYQEEAGKIQKQKSEIVWFLIVPVYKLLLIYLMMFSSGMFRDIGGKSLEQNKYNLNFSH